MSLKNQDRSQTDSCGRDWVGLCGLPLLHAFHAAGFPVLGFDVDQRKIEALHRGENYLKHLGATMVSDMQRGGGEGRFDATSDMGRLARRM